jgi:hypothetical protein
MRIKHTFEYNPDCYEIADEFCDQESTYQAEAINEIGLQFKIWSQDKAKTMTHVQILEIAEQLNDNGKWFIETLCEYMRGNT